MLDTVKNFKNHSREALLDLPQGTLDDYDLLQLAQYFEEEDEDEEREAAVWELILRSPLIDQMVDYTQIYQDLIRYYQTKNNWEAVLRWSAAYLAYTEQHEEEPETILESWRELGRVYLEAGHYEDGVSLFTRLLKRNSGDIWTYNTLMAALENAGLHQLALDTAQQGLSLLKNADPEDLQDQFEEMVETARSELENGSDASSKVPSDMRAALTTAWSAAVPQAEPAGSLEHLPPISGIIRNEAASDGEAEQEILKLGRSVIPELIHLGMDQELAESSQAPLRAAQMLNKLRAQGISELDALADWLDRLPNEGERMWLGTSFGKVGSRSIEELETIARDPNLMINWRDAAVEDLVARAQKDNSLRPRITGLIRELINREGADSADEEALTAFLIGSALDLKAVELLPDMERAFAEDRVDTEIVDRGSIFQELDLPDPRPEQPPAEGFSLRLKCASCGRTRRHFTKFVILDQTQAPEGQEEREMVVLDHEVVCPKCGARDQYSMPGFELVQIMNIQPENLMRLVLGETPDAPPRYKPDVYFLRSSAMGHPMHVLDAVDAYRQQIAREPRNAELYLRLANIFRTIGRYEQALEAYRHAVSLDGDDSDILISAATAEHDLGDLEEAKRLYQRCIDVEKKADRSLLAGLSENEIMAVQGLNLLRKGKPSSWEYVVRNSQGKLLLPPARAGMETMAKKDKRPHRHGNKR